MENVIYQPHDSVFKQSMSDVRVAKDFFEARLPNEILENVQLSTLHLESHSFIDDRLNRSESDIVYSVMTKTGNSAYFYLLCEQQSQVHHNMPFRLLKYQVRLMERHLKQNPTDPLPIIYPMVE